MKLSKESFDKFTNHCGNAYRDDALKVARFSDRWVEIDQEDFENLQVKHGFWIKPNRGLGDAVAAVAQPIAKAIDAVAGTNVQGCGACKKRQEALNKLIPSL